MKTIRFISCFLLLSVLASCRFISEERDRQADESSRFEIGKGINISHWLSQVTPWMKRDTFITRTDIQQIASFGFDHIRIPIDEAELWDESGKPVEEAFSYLKQCLDWCREYKLRAIVDLHILRSHHFNAGNNEGKITLWNDTVAQMNFIGLWDDISVQLKHYPVDMLAYELLNEPVADDPEDWNKLIARTVVSIRKTEPRRILIIGSNMWQTAKNFPYLKVPEGDTNIILSVHTYDPMPVTHYKASWTALKDYDGPVRYPGISIAEEDVEKYTTEGSLTRNAIYEFNRNYNAGEFEEILRPAIEKAKFLKLRLYCGEFGCLPTPPREIRLAYYRDITSVFEKYDISYAAWDYKGDFAIVPYDRKAAVNLNPDMELINILLRTKNE